MFDQHYFGLSARPFQLTPDPDFWFESATHRKAMAYLSYGLALGEGFIVITGEVGAGKTTLLAHLLATLDRARVETVQITPLHLAQHPAVAVLAQAVGVGAAASLAEQQAAVEGYLAQLTRMGKRLLIAIDEAQCLNAQALEDLRLVSNINLGAKPVVQFLLLGQPEFRKTLEDPNLVQLAQRVIARHHLTGLVPEEIQAYLEHRLRCAGWQGQPKLSEDLAAYLARPTQGVPRCINQIMTRALMMTALEGHDEVHADSLERVSAELQAEAVGALVGKRHGGSAQKTPSAVANFDHVAAGLREEVAQLSARVAAQEAALQRMVRLVLQWMEGADAPPPPQGAGQMETWP